MLGVDSGFPLAVLVLISGGNLWLVISSVRVGVLLENLNITLVRRKLLRALVSFGVGLCL